MGSPNPVSINLFIPLWAWCNRQKEHDSGRCSKPPLLYSFAYCPCAGQLRLFIGACSQVSYSTRCPYAPDTSKAPPGGVLEGKHRLRWHTDSTHPESWGFALGPSSGPRGSTLPPNQRPTLIGIRRPAPKHDGGQAHRQLVVVQPLPVFGTYGVRESASLMFVIFFIDHPSGQRLLFNINIEHIFSLKGNCSPSENTYFLINFKKDFGLNWSECKINIYSKRILFQF